MWGHENGTNGDEPIMGNGPTDPASRRREDADYRPSLGSPVSYTHLTLPTILRV